MACGGCGARRAQRAGAAAGTETKYRITWGDGSTSVEDSVPAARLAMGKQSDSAKRKGMRMTAFAS